MADPIFVPPPSVVLFGEGAIYIGERHLEQAAFTDALFLRSDGRICAGSTVPAGGRWLTLGAAGGWTEGAPLPPFANLSFDAGVAGWDVVSNVAPAEPTGFISLGNGAGAVTATLRQSGRREVSPGQSVTVGIRAQFHGTSGGTYGTGHASENVTLRIVWFRANGLELSMASAPVKNGAGLVGWQDIPLTASAPVGAASYSIEVLVDISAAGAVVDLDAASYNDPAGSGP